MDTLTHGDYKVGWICPLPIEVTAALAMLDGDEHPRLTQPHTDKNNYTLGRIGEHNVVITGLPLGRHGIPSATRVATNMMATFDSIEFYLLVGIGGGVPTKADIRLGDVVVSKGSSRDGGVVQYDAGKKVPGGFKRMWTLNAPPSVLAAALTTMEAKGGLGRCNFTRWLSKLPPKYQYPTAAKDRLFPPNYEHTDEDDEICELCDDQMALTRSEDRKSTEPVVHYGTIASGHAIMQDTETRDRFANELRAFCFEMEAAGLMNDFPCVVIRGISDYCDSHKNDMWKPYAASVAAAYAKELLYIIAVDKPTTPPGNTQTKTEGSAEQISTFNASPSTFYKFNYLLLPPTAIALGRLVIDTSAPWEEYCPSTIEITAKDMDILTQARLKQIIERTRGGKIYNKLVDLFVTILGFDPSLGLKEFNFGPEKTYLLLNSGNYFKELCFKDGVREWFATTVIENGLNCYLTVAMHALNETWVGGHPSALRGETAPSSQQTLGTAGTGEVIAATQYRRVLFRYRDENDPSLETGDSPWIVIDIGRGTDKKTRIVEAALCDTIEDISREGEVTFVESEFAVVL
jgi:nucleoside phosphorylase